MLIKLYDEYRLSEKSFINQNSHVGMPEPSRLQCKEESKGYIHSSDFHHHYDLNTVSKQYCLCSITGNHKQSDEAYYYGQDQLKPFEYQPYDFNTFVPSNFSKMEYSQSMMFNSQQQQIIPNQAINFTQQKVKVTKRNARYMAELQGYDYAVEDRIDQKTGRIAPMFICKYQGDCDQEFPRSWNLLDHIRMHYNIRPYQCHYCNYRFTQKGNLNKHMVKHMRSEFNSRRKYRCNECNKVFKKKNSYMVSSSSNMFIRIILCYFHFING